MSSDDNKSLGRKVLEGTLIAVSGSIALGVLGAVMGGPPGAVIGAKVGALLGGAGSTNA